MNPRELVDHIRSGPVELVLRQPLLFRRGTRSNPCDFNEFLEALQSSETIREVICSSHLMLGIEEDEWVLLLKTLGSIKDVQHFNFNCSSGSRDFHPLQAVAEAVDSAHSLRKLSIGIRGETFPRDSSGPTALASALRKQACLQEFSLRDFRPMLEEAQSTAFDPGQSTAFDPVLRVLSACPHLQLVFIMTKCASADAMKNLLQLQSATALHLVPTPDQLLAVADEIRLVRCHRKKLTLWMVRSSRCETTEVVKAVASAIRRDCHLECLVLQMEDGFTDEAGVALAEALKINSTLRILVLSDKLFASDPVPTTNNASLGARAYEAFGAMLRVNPSINLTFPAFDVAQRDDENLNQMLRNNTSIEYLSTYNAASKRDLECRHQMFIELRLNRVGRGRLLRSSQPAPREEWVNALQELNITNDNDLFEAIGISCVYSLLRLHPSICMLQLNDTTTTGL